MSSETENNSFDFKTLTPFPPQELFNIIIDYLSESLPKCYWNKSVSINCGPETVQSLSKLFNCVNAFDTLEIFNITEQKQYNENCDINYQICSNQSLFEMSSKSVQLLTACQSIHWIDLSCFMSEMDRILVTKGVLSLIGYSLNEVLDLNNSDDNRISDLLLSTFVSEQLIPYKKDYERINFPDNYETKFLDGFILTRDIKAHQLSQVVKSWPSFQCLENNDKQCADSLVERFETKLKDILNNGNLFHINLVLQTPFFVIMGRKKFDH